MKTAISIPDDVFDLVEDFAKRQQMTRSALFTAAAREYVQRRRSQDVTQALNAVYDQEDSSLDPVLELLQSASLPKETW
jgi:metal-responsive CopG/Arc/MetJ family transcriptional regulator